MAWVLSVATFGIKCRFGRLSTVMLVVNSTYTCASLHQTKGRAQYPVAISVDGTTYVTSTSVKVSDGGALVVWRLRRRSPAFCDGGGLRQWWIQGNETAYCRFGATGEASIIAMHVVPRASAGRASPLRLYWHRRAAPGGSRTGRDAPQVTFRYEALPSPGWPPVGPSGGGVPLTGWRLSWTSLR